MFLYTHSRKRCTESRPMAKCQLCQEFMGLAWLWYGIGFWQYQESAMISGQPLLCLPVALLAQLKPLLNVANFVGHHTNRKPNKEIQIQMCNSRLEQWNFFMLAIACQEPHCVISPSGEMYRLFNCNSCSYYHIHICSVCGGSHPVGILIP